MRILFFGSSEFSIPSLRACRESAEHELVLVITTPPQKQGRGLELKPTVVADFCRDNQITFKEYAKLDPNALKDVTDYRPEIFVVASYGKMIPESFLKLARLRLNVHPSLLPRYRGASPLNAPFLAGDTETGLSIADVTKELDAGDLYYQEKIKLSAADDSETIGHVLAEKAYGVLLDLLSRASSKLSATPQNPAQSSYAPKLKKEDGRLSWSDSVTRWDRLIRGLRPWPGAFIETQGERIALISARVAEDSAAVAPGKILEVGQTGLKIAASHGWVEWLKIKPAGKKEMHAADYARGKRWQPGMILA